MKSKQEKVFIKYIKFPCKKAKIKYPKIKNSTRMRYTAYATVYKNEIRYNLSHINDLSNRDIRRIAFHEVGHFAKRAYKRWESEYNAEKFASSLIKTYYYYNFKWYKEMLKDFFEMYRTQKEKWQLPYIKAFKKLLKEV